jgi:phosphatidate cytidylyltransferase
LLARAVLAVLGMPVLLLCAYFGGRLLLTLVAVVTIIALGEYYSAVMRAKMFPSAWWGYLAALALLVVTATTAPEQRDLWVLVILAVTVALAFVGQFGGDSYEGATAASAITAFGVAYVGLLMSFFLRLAAFDLPAALGNDSGPVAARLGTLLLVTVPVWALDTFAFVVGSAWGRHPLCPHLSPRKTMEGAVAGFLGCVALTALLGWWLQLPVRYSLPLGAMLGVVAQVGDLSKSTIKRDLGIKDFGNVFGPHGGVLDRFDGLLFAMPVAWVYLTVLFGQ